MFPCATSAASTFATCFSVFSFAPGARQAAQRKQCGCARTKAWSARARRGAARRARARLLRWKSAEPLHTGALRYRCSRRLQAPVDFGAHLWALQTWKHPLQPSASRAISKSAEVATRFSIEDTVPPSYHGIGPRVEGMLDEQVGVHILWRLERLVHPRQLSPLWQQQDGAPTGDVGRRAATDE